MDTPVASEWQKQGIAAKAPRKEDMAPAPILFARNVFDTIARFKRQKGTLAATSGPQLLTRPARRPADW